MAEVQVKLYLDEMMTKVNDATEALLSKLALRTEERTKMNIRTNGQIDTGFMVNSIYTITSKGSGYANAASAVNNTHSSKTGREVDHSKDMADAATLDEPLSSAVVVGANYAVFNEARKAFLYPAASDASREFGLEAVATFKEVGA
jgi:hypothetical protein